MRLSGVYVACLCGVSVCKCMRLNVIVQCVWWVCVYCVCVGVGLCMCVVVCV